MTLIALESFDMVPNTTDLELKGWLVDQGTNLQGSSSIVSGGRHGSQALKIAVNSTAILGYTIASTLQQLIPSNEHATFSCGFGFYWETGSMQFFKLMSDSTTTTHVVLGVSNTGQIQVFAGPGLPMVGASNFFIRPNVWNYLELSTTLGTSENISVNINDALMISLSGINTKNGGSKVNFDSFGFFSSSETNVSYLVDDVYLTNGAGSVNTGMLGDLAVVALAPNGNGDESQLINDNGNSTNNYTYVNSATTQTTTFVESPTAGNEDTYQMTDLPYPTGVVLGVQTVMLTNKNNTGARTFAPVIRESGSDHVGTPVYLGTGIQYQQQIFEEDPGTSTQWTIAGVNGAQFGAQVG